MHSVFRTLRGSEGRRSRLLLRIGGVLAGALVGLAGLTFTAGQASADDGQGPPPPQQGLGGAVGIIALNNVGNDNDVLSNNATNLCAVAGCGAGTVEVNQSGADGGDSRGGQATGLIAVNNVGNNNDILSDNARNACLVADCGAGTVEVNGGSSGDGDGGGGQATGLIGVNNVGNDNDVLSHNATNACLVADCGAGTVEVNGGSSVDGGSDGGSSGDAVGLVAMNNVGNNNAVLSHNATNFCAVAFCEAHTADLSFGSGDGASGDGGALGLIAVNDVLNGNDVVSHNATNFCAVAFCEAHTADLSFGGGGDGGSGDGGALGPVAVNDVLKGNDVLSNNATNFCAVAFCEAGTFEFMSGETHSVSPPSGPVTPPGGETLPGSVTPPEGQTSPGSVTPPEVSAGGGDQGGGSNTPPIAPPTGSVVQVLPVSQAMVASLVTRLVSQLAQSTPAGEVLATAAMPSASGVSALPSTGSGGSPRSTATSVLAGIAMALAGLSLVGAGLSLARRPVD